MVQWNDVKVPNPLPTRTKGYFFLPADRFFEACRVPIFLSRNRGPRFYPSHDLAFLTPNVYTPAGVVFSGRSPQLTVFLAGGGYLVFLVLFLPLYAISFIVTATGAWAVLLGAVYAGGRGLTQTISYPGQSRQIQRELEMEYTKNVSARLVSLTTVVVVFL